MRHWIKLFEESVQAARQRLDAQLHSDELSEDDREELLDQYGILDDLQLTDDGSLVIYRYLEVSLDWLHQARPDMTPVGIYWASEPTIPLGTHTPNMRSVFLIGTLAPEYQSFAGILELASVGENEVRLDAGDPVRITGVEVDGKEVHLPNWIGHIYRA